MSEPDGEVPVCAAWMTDEGVPVRGHRHCYCRDTAVAMRLTPAKGRDSQGFMTSRGRFVGREEACRLFVAAGMRSATNDSVMPYNARILFSEDLY